jgi:aconitate hydratase 2/2-methylisocitrate dehydratase
MVKVEFEAPLVVAPPTYNIVDELKAEGDWEVYKDTVLSLTIMFKGAARTECNMLYLESGL